MKKKVIAHLKGDIKGFKKEASEDKELIKALKHEKGESKKHEKAEHKKKRHSKKKHAKKVTHKKKSHAKESSKFKSKVSKVMHEFKAGKLHSGSKKGPMVSNPKQAIAISLSEARKATK